MPLLESLCLGPDRGHALLHLVRLKYLRRPRARRVVCNGVRRSIWQRGTVHTIVHIYEGFSLVTTQPTGRIRKFPNLTGRVGSSREVGRVGSGSFPVSRVLSGCFKISRVLSGCFQISRVGSGRVELTVDRREKVTRRAKSAATVFTIRYFHWTWTIWYVVALKAYNTQDRSPPRRISKLIYSITWRVLTPRGAPMERSR